MLIKETKYSYNDVAIVPAIVSEISSRSECCPLDNRGYYPIFTAPMSTVVDENTVSNFEDNKIYSIMPRSVSWDIRLEYARRTKRWIAVSLSEFEEHFTKKACDWNLGLKVLIDIANGHMRKLFALVRQSKNIYKEHLTVMIGNIANPQTYLDVINCGADLCRVSIGAGSGCITSSNASVHFPIVSLLDDINNIRKNYAEDKNVSIDSLPKIVADGGIRGYSDIIKALALGADYVMVGGLFSSLSGSAGEVYNSHDSERKPIDKNIIKYVGGGRFVMRVNDEELPFEPTKLFYGMASKLGQRDMGCEKLKTAEGLVKEVKLTSDIKQWTKNFDSYLRSAMSYTNALNLKRFQRNTNLVLISNATKMAINA